MNMAKTVAVVGAGPGGLTSIKACLEEGLLPTAFERRAVIGGLWNYDGKEWTDSKGAAVYRSLISNTSKEVSYFSDFPFPPDWPPYFTHREYLAYLNNYADAFDLREYIRLQHDVTRIEQAPDYDVSGKWRIRFTTEEDGEKEELFDHVIVCTGMFSEAWSPTHPGQDEFGGLTIHSNQYRTPDQFIDKNVLVVGDSYSAGDVATELGFHSKQVYLSMKKGCYVFPKRGAGGWPFDALLCSRWRYLIPGWLNKMMTQRFLEEDVDYDAYGLRPEHPLFRSDVIANDVILNQIIQGRVKTRPAIQRFLHRGVEFVDGSVLEDLDAVVFATGYRMRIPIIDSELVSDDFATRQFYKYILPVHLKHPSLALVGIIGVLGATGPSFEMQARWAARVFTGRVSLPPLPDMVNEIETGRQIMFEMNHKHTARIIPYFYDSDLAKDIGCLPNLLNLLSTDPALAYHMMVSPAVPATYRLVGPNSWPGARDAIMNCWSNYTSGTKGRECKRPMGAARRYYIILISFAVFALAWLLYM